MQAKQQTQTQQTQQQTQNTSYDDGGQTQSSVVKPREFKHKITEVRKATKNLVDLALKVGMYGNVPVSTTEVADKKWIKQKTEELQECLMSLDDDFKAKKSRRKKDNTQTMIRTPMFMTPEFISFFNEAGLGPAYEKREKTNSDGSVSVEFVEIDKDIKRKLPQFLKYGISSQEMNPSLLSLYDKIAGLQLSNDRSYMSADKLMLKYFSNTFEALKLNPDVKVKFDPSHFNYGAFNRIASMHRNKNLSPDQQNALKDPAFMQELKAESKIVSDTNEFYKTKKSQELRSQKKIKSNI